MRQRFYWLFERFKAIVGLLATFVIGYMPAIILLLVFVLEARFRRPWHSAALVTAAVVVWSLAIWTTRMADRAMRRCNASRNGSVCGVSRLPLAVEMGTHVPRVPWLLRLPLCLWWLAHFCLGIAYGVSIEIAILAGENAISALAICLLALSTFGLAFATNLYLVLALGVFRPAERPLGILWRWRFLIDLAAVFVPVAVRAMR